MKNKLLVFISSIFIFLFLLSSISHSQSLTPSLKITLNVSADEISQSRLHSLIAREFRTLTDIEIIERPKARFEISVVAVDATVNDNQKIGYTAALLITQFIRADDIAQTYANVEQANEGVYSSERIEEIKKEFNSTTAGKVVNMFLKRTVTQEYFVLLTDSNLENLAKRIVAETDYKFFDRIRGEYRQVRNGN